jgi:hypothetical protein
MDETVRTSDAGVCSMPAEASVPAACEGGANPPAPMSMVGGGPTSPAMQAVQGQLYQGMYDGAAVMGNSGAGGAPPSGDGAEGAPAGPKTIDYKTVANSGKTDDAIEAWFNGQDDKRPSNMSEIADDLKRKSDEAGGAKAGEVEIEGHGSAGSQEIGKGVSLGGKLSEKDAAALAKIGASMTPDGKITLGGCEVGEGEKGEAMMRAVAAAAGHEVHAGTARQIGFLPGIEGPEVIVSPDGTKRIETNWLKDSYAWLDKHVPW